MEHWNFLKKLNDVLGTNYKGTILLDMDDVLAELGSAWMDLYNERYKDSLTRFDMKQWNTSLIVKPECGVRIYDLLQEPGLFRYLKPTPHSQDVVQRLIDKGFNVLIVSDSPRGHAHDEVTVDASILSNPADDKRAWLAEYFPMIPQKNIFFGSQKYFVRGNVLVDDKPETFEIFSKLGLDVILIDQPYNQYIDTYSRAKNILEAEKLIYERYL